MTTVLTLNVVFCSVVALAPHRFGTIIEGQPWTWGLLAFIGVTLICNGLTVVYAVRRRHDSVL
jgi:uncharacterized membrane protein (DUF485 family)